MKILSILAQKPSSTGSGIFLTELLKNFQKMGEKQAVLYGIAKEDELPEFTDVESYPVYYESEELPFPVLGMSDEMPYKSTRYRDMTPEMLMQFKEAFLRKAEEAVEHFQPDIILCHHLYLLTAIIREAFPSIPVYGFCHNTDLRQMEKHDLMQDFIKENIQRLDRIYTPKDAQKKEVMRIYGVEPARIQNIAVGYNAERFCLPRENTVFRGGIERRKGIILPSGEKLQKEHTTDLLFAGKLGEKKGVFSLLRAVEMLYKENRNIRLFLAGDNGNTVEKEAVYALGKKCSYPLYFLGRLEQEELVKYYQFADVFTLPSFFDAVPLTALEALACGNKAVLSSLDGLEDFFRENCSDAPVFFAELPEMVNQDEMREEDQSLFEKRLKEVIQRAILYDYSKMASFSHLSWLSICKKIIAED